MNVASHKKRPPLHRQEAWLLGVLAVILVFTPWAFGTRDAWGQFIAAGLGLTAFILALWPRSYTDAYSVQGDFRLEMWPRLVRFPLFWLGCALLGLLVVQWLNPAWVWQQNDRMWWMKRIDNIEWLPSGTRTGFDRWNLWRTFLVYSAAWLTVCAIWVGVTRRRTLQVLVLIVLSNAAVLAVVGFAHRLSGEPKVLWLRAFKDSSSFSSFVYQNHGGAYFSLMASAALAMAVWHFFEGRKRMARSTPTAVWLVLAAFLVFAVVFSFSRGAMITLGVFTVGACFAFLIVRSANPIPSTMPRAVGVVLMLVFLGAGAFVVRHTDFSTVERKFEELTRLKANEPSFSGRAVVREASLDMWYDNWALGTGAGSFRYLFPKYLQNYPEAFDGSLWEHAHIDWLQIPIELGLTGVTLLLLAAGWMLGRFFRLRGWRHGLATLIFVGSTQTLMHALGDFPFQNAAVLIAWWSLLIIALRWLEIDSAADERVKR